jgi:adenylosuccinate synthase
MKAAFVVVDLQFGDACKGATVDYLGYIAKSEYPKERLLGVRYSGGYQSVHNVVLPDGRHHAYRQFSAATHHGADTHIGREFIFCPVSSGIERQHLQKQSMLPKPDPMSVDPKSLVATPYHRIMNLASDANLHGTTHCGIGAARKYWLDHGQDSVFAGDLQDTSILEDKIRLLWHRTRLYLSGIQLSEVKEERISEMLNQYQIGKVVGDLRAARKLFRLSSDLPECDVAIYEGSQGVLLDEYHGFHPHTTWSDLTTRCAVETIPDGTPTQTIGCIRAFTTRHGAGPLPSESWIPKTLMTEPHNVGGPPGAFRWGYLDMDLLRYAVKCQPVDCLAVSWLDKFAEPNGFGTIATSRYDIPLKSSVIPNLERNRETMQLDDRTLTSVSESELLQLLNSIAPVGIEGRGPTYLDRTQKG